MINNDVSELPFGSFHHAFVQYLAESRVVSALQLTINQLAVSNFDLHFFRSLVPFIFDVLAPHENEEVHTNYYEDSA